MANNTSPQEPPHARPLTLTDTYCLVGPARVVRPGVVLIDTRIGGYHGHVTTADVMRGAATKEPS